MFLFWRAHQKGVQYACRGPEEADAESVRTAVLLDELDFPGERPCSASAI